MDEAYTFMLSAPFITAGVELIKRVVPMINGKITPALTLAITTSWGGALVLTDRFTGDVAEFIVGVVVVASAAIGFNSTWDTAKE